MYLPFKKPFCSLVMNFGSFFKITKIIWIFVALCNIAILPMFSQSFEFILFLHAVSSYLFCFYKYTLLWQRLSSNCSMLGISSSSNLVCSFLRKKRRSVIPVYDKNNIHQIKEDELVLTVDQQSFCLNAPSEIRGSYIISYPSFKNYCCYW